MSDLVEFLSARIAEDEASARAVGGGGAWVTSFRQIDDHHTMGPQGRWLVASEAQEWGCPVEIFAEIYLEYPYGAERRTAEHIARHDPAGVLAECEAKRRIVENLAWVRDHPGQERPWIEFATTQLRWLARPYADHPEYDPEWHIDAPEASDAGARVWDRAGGHR